MNNSYLEILPEIKQALTHGKPVVALESTIISHGMPYPENIKTAKELDGIVRENGAVPATIAILNGKMKVGLSDSDLEFLATSK
ncbi:MAG TPA: pseudouridine-5-phosphate glycosidase, partial [Candidatus Cloacimonetes bacterium]|nr:pseudouridine-5-phosphate glycosidase [Candidatus Cloacimonadota bacterium]HEX37435.1 pseudouridine-5-phosphate glycosidase [Candidatus Cloacimonadota bacterium]